MARYTDTQVFPLGTGPFSSQNRFAHVAVQVNGGRLDIAAVMADGSEVALPESPFTKDTVFVLEVGSGRWKFVPSGGAAYEFTL